MHAPPRRRRLAKGIAFTLALVVVVGVAGGYYYWHSIAGLFDRTTVSLDPVTGGPLNVLMVGSDSRAGLDTPADIKRFGTVGGKRSDTIILAQIVPGQQRGVLVSIPRDMWVPVHHGGHIFYGKINSAYQYGPQAVIDTVTALTRVRINHYIEVNFGGFRKMVDAIGGIDICNAQSFYDPIINFQLSRGMHHLNGNDALMYVRTRHATADGDFGRIKRQQEFIRAVMGKVGRPTVLGNPLRVNALATAFAQNVTVDQFFQLNDLVRLALSIRRVGASQLVTYSVPGDVGRMSGESVVIIDRGRAEPLFQALRNGTDPAKTVTAVQPTTAAPKRAPTAAKPAPTRARTAAPAPCSAQAA